MEQKRSSERGQEEEEERSVEGRDTTAYPRARRPCSSPTQRCGEPTQSKASRDSGFHHSSLKDSSLHCYPSQRRRAQRLDCRLQETGIDCPYPENRTYDEVRKEDGKRNRGRKRRL